MSGVSEGIVLGSPSTFIAEVPKKKAKRSHGINPFSTNGVDALLRGMLAAKLRKESVAFPHPAHLPL